MLIVVKVNNVGLIRNPLDTGFKLNLQKTFRRCSGRLLNALCRFNLRFLSKGESILVVMSFIVHFKHTESHYLLVFIVNPSVPNAPFLDLLKTENLTVFGCSQGEDKGYIGSKWVNIQHLVTSWVQRQITLISNAYLELSQTSMVELFRESD